MICNRCGANVPEGINFCIKCGSDLRRQAPAPASQPAPAPVQAPAPAPVQATAPAAQPQPQAPQRPVYPQAPVQQPPVQPRLAQQPPVQPGAQPVQAPVNPVPVPQPVAVPSAEVNRAANQPPRQKAPKQKAPKQKAPKAPKEKTANKGSGMLVPFIIALILALAFAACFALLYFDVFDFGKKSSDSKNAEVSDSADKDSGKNDEGKSGDDSSAALSAKAERYDAVVSFFSEDTPHVGSDRFYADTPVVVLSMKDESATFGITANFLRQANVAYSAGTDVAVFEWTEESWKKNTDIRVTPKAPGTTVITFTNDLNDATFQVLVIVTE